MVRKKIENITKKNRLFRIFVLVHGGFSSNYKSYGAVRCGYNNSGVLRCGSAKRSSYSAVQCDFEIFETLLCCSLISCIPWCGSVRFSEISHRTVCFGAVINPTVRFFCAFSVFRYGAGPIPAWKPV